MGLTKTCRILTSISCVLTFISTIFHAVAFGTRRWIVSKEESPFRSIGFHEACFTNCRDPYCPASGDISVEYNGCHWLWNYYFQEIYNWLRPEWFMICRDLAIVNVPLIAITFIILAVCTSLAFTGRHSTETSIKSKTVALQVLLFISACLLLAACIMNMFIMATLYTNGFERGWMPIPEKNGYGFSFWLNFTATIMMTIAFLMSLFAGVVTTYSMYSDKDPRYSEDMMLGMGHSVPTPSPSLGSQQLGMALKALDHRTV